MHRGGGGWRGSTGSLWAQRDTQRGDGGDLSRPTSASPPEELHPKGRKRRSSGLRRRFHSLTEGLSSVLTSKKHHPSGSDSPDLSRKSTFYVDIEREGRDTFGANGYEKYSDSENNNKPREYKNYALIKSSLHARQTRSMSKVKAPPSPPPRRYTLWGVKFPIADKLLALTPGLVNKEIHPQLSEEDCSSTLKSSKSSSLSSALKCSPPSTWCRQMTRDDAYNRSSHFRSSSPHSNSSKNHLRSNFEGTRGKEATNQSQSRLAREGSKRSSNNSFRKFDRSPCRNSRPHSRDRGANFANASSYQTNSHKGNEIHRHKGEFLRRLN